MPAEGEIEEEQVAARRKMKTCMLQEEGTS